MGTEFFDHPNMISVILSIHGNPGCSADDIVISCGCDHNVVEEDVSVLVETDMVIFDSTTGYRLTAKGMAVASHLLDIEGLMLSSESRTAR